MAVPMTAQWRPPETYVYGAGSDSVVIVPAVVASWLDRKMNFRSLSTSVRGQNVEFSSVFAAMNLAALNWRSASADGSERRKSSEVESPSDEWMTTRAVADALDLTTRAVTDAIAGDRLAAMKIGRQWQVARTDFELYRAQRAA